MSDGERNGCELEFEYEYEYDNEHARISNKSESTWRRLHVRGDVGDLNERSSSFSGDPVSIDFISLLLWVNSSLRLFFTSSNESLWSESESPQPLLGDRLECEVSPVADVTAELLSQTISRFGCGCNVMVMDVGLGWTASRISVTVDSFIFITIIVGIARFKLKLAQGINEKHFQFNQKLKSFRPSFSDKCFKLFSRKRSTELLFDLRRSGFTGIIIFERYSQRVLITSTVTITKIFTAITLYVLIGRVVT